MTASLNSNGSKVNTRAMMAVILNTKGCGGVSISVRMVCSSFDCAAIVLVKAKVSKSK